ncbi:MAG: SDR family NAD(P)-dependent oxidoreductase [Isosphaeraceae bacterium]|nr:SDR family NAD(P)-dependent oxidoreductase [Isosphaeraceae bacterium]
MKRSFVDRAAVITGASSGIGRELAKALAREGCRVGLVARRQALLDELAGAIRQAGGTVAAAAADVGDREQIRQAIAGIAATIGPIDLLVANAGVGINSTIEPVNVEAAEQTFQINVLGVIYAIDAVLPAMLARGNGHIAAISSLAAYRSLPGIEAYAASKAAVNAYLDGFRIRARKRGIAVTTICPGYVHTPMTANNTSMPFVLTAEDAAARIVRALRGRRKIYNFPWPTAMLAKLGRWAPDWLIAAM